MKQRIHDRHRMLCSVAVACAVCSCAAGEPTGPTEVPNILLVVLLAVAVDGIVSRAGADLSPGVKQLINVATLLVTLLKKGIFFIFIVIRSISHHLP